MKVKDYHGVEYDIFAVRTVVERDDNGLCYFVYGQYYKGFMRESEAILLCALDVTEALYFEEDIRKRMEEAKAASVMRDADRAGIVIS